MSRVEIPGQLNANYPWFSNRQPILIERNPSSISTTGISNWNQFCDSVDEVLVPLTKTKSIAKISYALFIGYIFLFVGSVFVDFIGGYTYEFVWPIIGIIMIVTCYVRTQLTSTMKKVEEVCSRYSASGVTYTLKSEYWGGCNQPHVKRYYIDVVIVDGPSQNSATDVEQQQNQTEEITVSNYFSTPAETETSPPATSLANMLNSDTDVEQQQNQKKEATVSNYFSTSAETETTPPTTSLADMLK
mmetsp:Transcript_27151/g.49289  ORF Transcript_27151/g.49289 Transcript_27151/m.49289 type:complete len:245 (-) Transcript_27151:86-820(-)